MGGSWSSFLKFLKLWAIKCWFCRYFVSDNRNGSSFLILSESACILSPRETGLSGDVSSLMFSFSRAEIVVYPKKLCFFIFIVNLLIEMIIVMVIMILMVVVIKDFNN